MPKKITVLVLDDSSDFRKGTGVIRGGSCLYDSANTRPAVREWIRHVSGWDNLGFRIIVGDPWPGR